MSRHPRAGHKAERKVRATPATAPEQNPLDFALAFMRDESKPDALRVSVAKAAMPYLHKRGEENDEQVDAPEPKPKSEPMSDLELARRIAHILARGNEQAERERGTATPHVSPANAGQLMPSALFSADDEREERIGPPDPHPGYRWVP